MVKIFLYPFEHFAPKARALRIGLKLGIEGLLIKLMPRE